MTLAPTSNAVHVWERILCAVDLSPASIAAARLAAALMPPTGRLTMCTVLDRDVLEGAALLDTEALGAARAAVAQAQAQIESLHAAELHLREGPPVPRILEELRGEQATLVSVGSSGRGRVPGILLGSVATAMVHEAPCAVLVAPEEPPSGADVVVGYDGSGGAQRALAAGRELCERLGLPLRVVTATSAMPSPAAESITEQLGGLEARQDPRPALEALTEASGSARLLVLGSRHLRGVLALSSVSERAAHQARCPVLLVR